MLKKEIPNGAKTKKTVCDVIKCHLISFCFACYFKSKNEYRK